MYTVQIVNSLLKILRHFATNFTQIQTITDCSSDEFHSAFRYVELVFYKYDRVFSLEQAVHCHLEKTRNK